MCVCDDACVRTCMHGELASVITHVLTHSDMQDHDGNDSGRDSNSGGNDGDSVRSDPSICISCILHPVHSTHHLMFVCMHVQASNAASPPTAAVAGNTQPATSHSSTQVSNTSVTDTSKLGVWQSCVHAQIVCLNMHQLRVCMYEYKAMHALTDASLTNHDLECHHHVLVPSLCVSACTIFVRLYAWLQGHASIQKVTRGAAHVYLGKLMLCYT
jgi:hypothetical protein